MIALDGMTPLYYAPAWTLLIIAEIFTIIVEMLLFVLLLDEQKNEIGKVIAICIVGNIVTAISGLFLWWWLI